jgi:hypothetical protein
MSESAKREEREETRQARKEGREGARMKDVGFCWTDSSPWKEEEDGVTTQNSFS